MKNLGIPSREYFTITSLNEQYASYRYSMVSAIEGKSRAAGEYWEDSFRRAFRRAASSSSVVSPPGEGGEGGMSATQRMRLLVEEKEFLRKGRSLAGEMMRIQRKITDWNLREEMDGMDVKVRQVEVEVEVEVSTRTAIRRIN